ncbi:MAG: hypothetical protein GXO08_03745 [Aquificae bacterium]|nr:hypothetical protein [Aquificota bacterium]
MEAAVVLKSDPFSWKAIQAYKIAAALSKRYKVYFVAIKEGVYFLTDWSPEGLGYENFRNYEVNRDNLIFVVDRDDFEVRGLGHENLWTEGFKLVEADEREIGKILKRSTVVGVW